MNHKAWGLLSELLLHHSEQRQVAALRAMSAFTDGPGLISFRTDPHAAGEARSHLEQLKRRLSGRNKIHGNYFHMQTGFYQAFSREQLESLFAQAGLTVEKLDPADSSGLRGTPFSANGSRVRIAVPPILPGGIRQMADAYRHADRHPVPRVGPQPTTTTGERSSVAVGSRMESTMSTVKTPLLPRFVPLTTGVTLPYVESGDPTGTPVVFLHGITDSWRSFEPVLPHLTSGIRAFALTLRGHGEADRPASGYRLADYAGDVAAFLDALNLDQAIIAGHSMGSSVAQRFVLDHPGRCRGLVLIGSAPTWRGNPDLVGVQEALAGMDDPLDPAFVYEFQASTVARPVPESLIATAVAESLLMPASIWREAFARLLATDFSAELGQIAVPMLLLAGERDELAPIAAQRALEGTIPDTHLIIYPGAGHASHWEDPAQVAADIATFVRALP